MAQYREREPEEQLVEEPSLTGTYTAEDYLKWRLDELVELIRGKIFKMSPAPNLFHQRLVVRFTELFAAHFKGHPCEVVVSPADVFLIKPGEDYRKTPNVVEPDLFVVCDKSKLRPFGCVGAPDFVIEILSPSNSRKDITHKHELYEEYGVKEYWMIQVTDRLVIINLLENGKYVTQRPRTVGDIISPRQFPRLEVDLEELFAGIDDLG